MARRQAAIPAGIGHSSPVFVDHASGALLHDVDGNTFIDFAGGIGTLNVGHAHPAVVEAARAQLDRFTHTCFAVTPYESYVELAERLNTRVKVTDIAQGLIQRAARLTHLQHADHQHGKQCFGGKAVGNRRTRRYPVNNSGQSALHRRVARYLAAVPQAVKYRNAGPIHQRKGVGQPRKNELFYDGAKDRYLEKQVIELIADFRTHPCG